MLKKVKLKDLVPFDKNPRINDKAVDRVLESLKANGYVSPIVVNEINHPFKQHVIAAGHTRWKALQKFGSDEVEVFVYKFDSEKHFVRFNIEDNKTGEFAEWDETLLADLASEFEIDLKAMDFEFEVEEEPSEGLTDPDDVPEVPEEPTAKLGQIWKLGEHRLMCGDSTDREQVERLMVGEKADMVFTDPPYGIGESGSKNHLRGKLAKATQYEERGWDNKIPDKQAFDNMFEFSKEQIIWGGNYFIEYLKNSPCWIVWDKNNNKNDFADCELAWCSMKTAVRMFKWTWNGMLQEDMKNKEKRFHPTQKPVGLFLDIFKTYSFESCIDLFGGSGSTLIACEKTGRKCRMMELDPKYCDVIIKRWEDFTGKKAELINA